MHIPADTATVHARLRLYLHSLGITSEAQQHPLASAVLSRTPSPNRLDPDAAHIACAMESLETVLKERRLSADDQFDPVLDQLQAGPPIQRSPFAYRPYQHVRKEAPAQPVAWRWTATWRRLLFAALVLGTAGYAAVTQVIAFGPHNITALELAIIVIFTVLFAWISVGFTTALLGFFNLLKRRHPHQVSQALLTALETIPAAVRIAIVMPIYNEEVPSVFAGVETMQHSLAATQQAARFDWFILSDSTDPDRRIQEEATWADLCRKLNATGRIFYRHRRHRSGKKSGNIADFVRRWGRLYKYMIVVDADSFLSGPLMVNLARLMEARPDIGILQTTPKLIRAESLLARVQQFASHVYAPLYLAGLHFWQLGEAAFWGHNAIIRLDPFRKYCALPKLRRGLPFSGDILSHDFVESALMGRAGWGVWLAPDLPGSYEQPPATLLTELKRDRRWCRGNLQHLRLIAMRGVSLPHRGLFLSGAMFYGSSLLWALLMVLLTLRALIQFIQGPRYFPAGPSLFPVWPVHAPALSWSLVIVTVLLLLLPKLLAILHLVVSRQARQYGGLVRAISSVAGETLLSILLSPVRMFYHALYVATSLFGEMRWEVYRWSERSAGLLQICRHLRAATVQALWWGPVLYIVDRTLFWWLTPVLIPLILCIPVAAFVSAPSVGLWFRRQGLFLVPEERKIPPFQLRFEETLRRQPRWHPILKIPLAQGFVLAVLDPWRNKLHQSLVRGHHRSPVAATAMDGPHTLTATDKNVVLSQGAYLGSLHRLIWSAPPERFALWFQDTAPADAEHFCALRPNVVNGHPRTIGNKGLRTEAW